MAFNRGRRIASGLTAIWETHGSYPFARQALDAALTEGQILSGGEDLTGIHVMTKVRVARRGRPLRAVVLSVDTFLLPYRVTLDHDRVGVVDNPVADGVGQSWLADLEMPSSNIKLRTEDGGRSLMPCLDYFKEISGLAFF